MPDGPNLIVFNGPTSQTGLATLLEFPDIPFTGEDKDFNDIRNLLRTAECTAILPTWNSHDGEITKAWVLDLLFSRSARIYRLWPKPIRFECLSKTATRPEQLKRIISIGVAKNQCSVFLGTTNGAEFKSSGSTVSAYNEFHEDAALDGALCAPGQNRDGYHTITTNAENLLNFTSFALLGCNASKNWTDSAWGQLAERIRPSSCWFLGIEMPRVAIGRDEAVNLVLQELTRDAQALSDIPKILFVCERSSDTVGLMLESKISDLVIDTLVSEGESDDIAFVEDMGESNVLYTQRVLTLLNKVWNVRMGDFLRHRGTGSCFYACPPLDIVTHGFDQALVEPVVRRVIGKYFDLAIRENVQCSDTEREFFERHKDAYLERGEEAFTFNDIGY